MKIIKIINVINISNIIYTVNTINAMLLLLYCCYYYCYYQSININIVIRTASIVMIMLVFGAQKPQLLPTA